ncbi:MAG: hypothetical protein LAO06_15995, partial [Acidobacteriia bacterium]|nr:hypothetical protein [Terriglobia bacterium]
LLELARQIPTAPTSKRIAEVRPRFPYIEATGGRINLKLGQEKTVYALSNADFALSLPSENVWQLELEARPMRTDANLGDTGSVEVAGIIQRGSTLTDTPLNLRIALKGAQLGQLTTVIYGRDRGWRGTVNVSATLKGTPSALKIAGEASVGDFRRYDIGTRGSLRLAARCSAAFSTGTQQLTDISCRAPAGPGAVEIRGGIAGILPVRSYTLAVAARDLPASSLMALALRMKKDLPEDMQASGTVSAAFHLLDAGSGASWTGGGATSGLRVTSRLMSSTLLLGQIQFLLGVPGPMRGKPRPTNLPSTTTVLRLAQFPVDLGASAPAKAQAWFGRNGYNVDLDGDARVNRLLELAHAFGVHAPQATIAGLATADLNVAGAWAGFAAPVVTGNLLLRSVTAAIPGIAAPLQVTTAALHLAPDAAAVDDLAGSFTGTHLSFTGSLQVPRVCPAGPCPIAF